MSHTAELFTLQGKVALVSGAAGHLGGAITQALAGAGAHVLVNGRRADQVERAVSALRARGLSAEAAVFDVTDEGAVAAFLRGWAGSALHVLVNNAYEGGAGSFELADPAAYRRSYEVAVVGAHNLVRGALERLRSAAAGGGASVINVASMYALVSPDQRVYAAGSGANPPYYGAAKAALVQWTRYLACELAPQGIRVNCISPGPFPSAHAQAADPMLMRKLTDKVPLARLGAAAELGGPVLFLASQASSYVTGANLVVDGGWTCW